jgi:anti-anti-sigma factor
VTDLARIETRKLNGGRLVRVSGEIDLSNARDLMDAIAGAVPHDASLVVVDLTGTTYLDSSGIAMIFRLAERLGHRRQELRLVAPSAGPIRAVMELTNVDRVIPVLETFDGMPDPI